VQAFLFVMVTSGIVEIRSLCNAIVLSGTPWFPRIFGFESWSVMCTRKMCSGVGALEVDQLHSDPLTL
jgi:hypothetical protein